jgi:hypothetical protein
MPPVVQQAIWQKEILYSVFTSVEKSQWLENPDHPVMNKFTEAG